jgi:predicted ATPase
VRFTHLHLENWRNFTRVDTDLQGRVFLVGPNASGKSNFLDAFRFLRDIAAVGGGFQEAVQQRGGVSKLRALAARRYPDLVVGVDIGDDDGDLDWKYVLRFAQDNRQRPFVKQEVVRRDGVVILERPDDDDQQDPERLRQTHLEQVNANRSFREVAEFFSTVRYLHIVPQLVREPDRSIGRVADPFGGDFLEQLARTPSKTRDARLRRIGEALKVAVPQLRELKLDRDDRGTPHLQGLYEHWRPNAGWQTEEQLSDGTLRLLGLMWALLDGSGPLLLEEPELSLHADVVRFVPQMMARIQRRLARQILVSTHSSDLLRDEGIALDEVLLLTPGTEGTEVKRAADLLDVPALLGEDISMAEAVLPRTKPKNAQQLALFGD